MAYENIQIDHGNFTIDRSGSAFYTVDHEDNTLIKKQSDGTVIFTYFLDRFVTEVYSLQFDGVYFWTLERSGDTGFEVKKWEIGDDNLVRAVSIFSYSSDAVNKYRVNSLSVEFYKDTLDGQVLTGASSFDVNDGSVVEVGDELVIGPSTATGFEGEYSTVTVINKSGTTLTVSPAVSVDFSPNEEVYFTRSFFVFSDDAPGNLSGALYKFEYDTGTLQTVDVSNIYHDVTASTFFKSYIMFVKGGEVLWLNPDSQEVYKSQAIDNINENRASYYTTYDLAGYSNTIYRLERKKVYKSGGSYTTANWSKYNYNTSSVIPEVYFVSIKADPPILHKAIDGYQPESTITVQVLDQFRTPVFNRLVDLTSDGGVIDPIQDTTDTNGIITATYTANTSVGQVEIEATVT